MSTDAWTSEPLAPETVAAVRAGLTRLVDSIVAAIAAENRVYAEVLSDPAGMGIRLGIEQAIATFLDAAQRGQPPAAETDEVWRRLGEAEFQAGRSLDALRAAFRTGTRAAWRAAASIAAEVGISTAAVIGLAEGIFVYSDALAADVVEGYLRMQSDETGEQQRRRRRLAALLLDRERHDPEALGRAAALARWPLPRELAAIALAAESAASVARGLGPDVLSGADADGSWLLLPDPVGPGRTAELRQVLSGVPSALGPSVEPVDAERSLRWARRALGLIAGGALPDERPTQVSEHLATLLVRGDEELAAAMSSRALEPLQELSPGERQRLLDTLAAWLDHQRHTPAVADQLHVHPQTVRYRMARLRELLGDPLQTPDGRFELMLALRAQVQLP